MINLSQAFEGLNRVELGDAIEAEIESIEEHMESLEEGPVMEAWDTYLCALQHLEFHVHSDVSLTDVKVLALRDQAERAQAGL